jgi:hypothetical protein
MLQSFITRSRPLDVVRRGIGMRSAVLNIKTTELAHPYNSSLLTATQAAASVKPLTGVRVLELGQVILKQRYMRQRTSFAPFI